MAYTSDNVEVVVGSIAITEKSELRVTRVDNKDGILQAVDARLWYCTANDPDFKPSKKGIRVAADKIDEFLDLFKQAAGKEI